MYHFDIPKTRQYDTGKIEVIARNSAGEAITSTELNIVARRDDYRGVLKNSPRRKSIVYKEPYDYLKQYIRHFF
jgi:titin